MKKLITIFTVLLSAYGHTETLIVPEKETDFAKYQEICLKPGYICTNQYFLSTWQNKETLKFDELMNSVDLSSKEFIAQFSKSVQSVLQAEMISVEQLEMLSNLTIQVKEVSDNKNQINLIFKELTLISELLNKEAAPVSDDRFLILFKKRILFNELKNLKLAYLKVPVVYLEFNQAPIISNSRVRQFSSGLPLLSGGCESPRVDPSVTGVTWQPYFSKTCSLSEDFGKVTTAVSKGYDSNKKWIWTGVALVGAALLLNQYEIQLQF